MTQEPRWKKTFFTIWIGQAFSLLSSSIVQYAIIWYLTDVTRSPAVLSVATLAGLLPQGLFGPFIGVYVDRWDRKKIMILSDICIALACLFIVVLGLFAELPVWLFLAVLFIRSVGSAFHAPSLSAVTPLIVPADQLTRCAGYSQTLQAASLIVSPAVAAILYAVWSLEAIIFLDVLGALIGVGTLAVCAIPKLEARRTVRPHVLRECLDGIRVLRSHKGLFGILCISSIFFLAYAPVNAYYPLMSMEYFGGTAVEAGIAESSMAAGMLAGAALLGVWGGFKRKIFSIFGSLTLIGVALIGCGILPPTGFAAFAAFSALMGTAVPFFNGPGSALFQVKIKPEYLGRVMSLLTSAMALASPIGLALAGVFTSCFSVNGWFLLAGIVFLVCAALCILIPSVRRCED